MLRAWWEKVRSQGLLVPSRKRDQAGPAKIAVQGLFHRYRNEVEALKEVNLDVQSGEFVCLLGPSGCGKSTLLYALAGTAPASGGTIRIDGQPIIGPGPDRLLMFQEAALFPWLTVQQNLTFALGARPLRPIRSPAGRPQGRGLSRQDRDRVAREYIQLVKLEGFEDALPHQLSGGMRMRVSLARALAMDPAVLLMDEPFGALDAQTREEMHALLQDIWLRSRKTVVFVTHNIREAITLGDRVVVMAGRPGRVLQDLEVRLPRPRDPDDERLARLSRQIREALREADQATLARTDSGVEKIDVRPNEDHAAAGTSAGLAAGVLGPGR